MSGGLGPDLRDLARLRALYLATSAQSNQPTRQLFQEMLMDEMKLRGFNEAPEDGWWPADVGILSPLSLEVHEARGWLSTGTDYREWPDPQGRYHYCSTIELDSSQRLRVALVQPLHSGQLSISKALQSLQRYHDPLLTVVIGIGGGIGSRKIGDVILATDVTYYDPHAVTDAGIQREHQSFRIRSRLQGALNHFFQNRAGKEEWRLDDGFGDAERSIFIVERAPIASGSSVVKSKDAEVRASVTTVNRKTEIVETEAAAIAHAFYEDDDTEKLYIVLRGISDLANRDKDEGTSKPRQEVDRDRQIASQHAIIALQKLLDGIWADLKRIS